MLWHALDSLPLTHISLATMTPQHSTWNVLQEGCSTQYLLARGHHLHCRSCKATCDASCSVFAAAAGCSCHKGLASGLQPWPLPVPCMYERRGTVERGISACMGLVSSASQVSTPHPGTAERRQLLTFTICLIHFFVARLFSSFATLQKRLQLQKKTSQKMPYGNV